MPGRGRSVTGVENLVSQSSQLDETLANILQCEYLTSKTFGTRVFAGDQIQTHIQLLSTPEPSPRAGVINLVHCFS